MDTNLQPPSLGQTQPVYPPLLQLIRVTATTVSGPSGFAQSVGSSVLGPMLYVAFTQQLRDDGSLLPRDREPCLANAVNGLSLSPGFYLGRLAGAWTSLPVYEIVGPQVSGTFSTNTTFDGGITTKTIIIPDSGTAPATPASGNIVLYEIGGNLFIKNSSGTATQITGPGAGFNPIWDWVTYGTDVNHNRYYATSEFMFGVTWASQTFLGDLLYAVPICSTRAGVVESVGMYMDGTGVNFNVRIGIYDTDTTNNYPANLVLDFGTLNGGFPASWYAITGKAATLQTQKQYWMAMVCDSSNKLSSINTTTPGNSIINLGYSGANPPGLNPGSGWRIARAFGALPATFPGGVATATLLDVFTLRPHIWYRWSS